METVAEYADMLQIGSRNMQNYPLLIEAGKSGKPVLLKRGMAASLCEWLGAAEYIAKEGNLEIVLCERGIKAYPAGEYSRNVLDLSVIPAVKAETFLPVIVDPSHATGVASMVESASRAAIEFGSDGLLIEVACDHKGAARPKCDAAQAINPATLRNIVSFIDTRTEIQNVEESPCRLTNKFSSGILRGFVFLCVDDGAGGRHCCRHKRRIPQNRQARVPQATPRYANMPDEAVPYGKFAKPYKEWFVDRETRWTITGPRALAIIKRLEKSKTGQHRLPRPHRKQFRIALRTSDAAWCATWPSNKPTPRWIYSATG